MSVKRDDTKRNPRDYWTPENLFDAVKVNRAPDLGDGPSPWANAADSCAYRIMSGARAGYWTFAGKAREVLAADCIPEAFRHELRRALLATHDRGNPPTSTNDKARSEAAEPTARAA